MVMAAAIITPIVHRAKIIALNSLNCRPKGKGSPLTCRKDRSRVPREVVHLHFDERIRYRFADNAWKRLCEADRVIDPRFRTKDVGEETRQTPVSVRGMPGTHLIW